MQANPSGSGADIDELVQLPAEPEIPLGTWKYWTPLQTVPCNHTLFAVDALSKTDAWATGEAGTFMHWDGQTWQPAPSPTQEDLHAIDMLAATDGWAAGDDMLPGTGWRHLDRGGEPVAYSAHLSVSSQPDRRLGSGSVQHDHDWDGSAWTPIADTYYYRT